MATRTTTPALTPAARAIAQALDAFAMYVESHGAACVCWACLALLAGRTAADQLEFLAVLVDAGVAEGSRRCRHFAEACAADSKKEA